MYDEFGIDIDRYMVDKDYQREVLPTLPDDMKNMILLLSILELEPIITKIIALSEAMEILKVINGEFIIKTEDIYIEITDTSIMINRLERD